MPLRKSPPRDTRSKSRDRSFTNVMNASATIAKEVETDFVERGKFIDHKTPQILEEIPVNEH